MNPSASLHGCGQVGKRWGQYEAGVKWATGRGRETGRSARSHGSAIVYHEHIQQNKTFLANGWNDFFYKGTTTLSYVWACYGGRAKNLNASFRIGCKIMSKDSALG